MDTRAFRLPWPPGTTLWELDRPCLLDLENRILDADGATPGCDRRCLSIDLAQSRWPEALTAGGFRREELSAWLVEGFLQDLDEVAVHTLPDEIGTVAAPGSRLGVDVLSRDVLKHEWMAAYLEHLARHDTPWCFGTNEPEALLAGHGWQATAVQPGEKGANFARWPWPVAPRDIAGWPRSFLVIAARTGN